MPYPPLVVANAVQVRLVQSYAGNVAVNVLHARKTAGTLVDQALANSLGASIKASYGTIMAPVVSSGSGLLNVGVRDLTSPNQPEYLDSGTVQGGAAVEEHMPPYVCSVVTLKSALAGKSFTGRVYLGGFTEAGNDTAGLATAAVVTACVDFIEAVQGNMLAANLTLGVLSRPAYAYQDTRTWQLPEGETRVDVIGNGIARSGGIADVILIQSKSTKWETQRRRNNERGNPAALSELLPASSGIRRSVSPLTVQAAR